MLGFDVLWMTSDLHLSPNDSNKTEFSWEEKLESSGEERGVVSSDKVLRTTYQDRTAGRECERVAPGIYSSALYANKHNPPSVCMEIQRCNNTFLLCSANLQIQSTTSKTQSCS